MSASGSARLPPSFGLEMPVVQGPGRGGTIFIEDVTSKTTLADLGKAIKQRMPNVEVASIMAFFGDYGAKVLKSDKVKVTDFLCYTQQVPIYIREKQDGDDVAFVKALGGRTSPVSFNPAMTVDEFFFEVYDVMEGFPSGLRLIYGGRQLQKGHKLQEYNIKKGSTIQVTLSLWGGCANTSSDGDDKGGSFVDVSKGQLVKRKFVKDAPDWRITCPGLCLEGVCKNEECEAFGEIIVMQFGYTNFDLIRDAKSSSCVCPMCNSSVTPIIPGFNNCYYRIHARKKGSTAVFQEPWIRCGHEYCTYDIDQCGVATWERLQILVKPLVIDGGDLPIPEKCAICFLGIDSKAINRIKALIESFVKERGAPYDAPYKMPNCDHFFHKSCTNQWINTMKGKDKIPTCPLCRMTFE